MSTLNLANDINGLEIAVIGMSGRFPGAKDLDTFWQNLRDGVESVSFFSDDELISSGVDPRLLNDSSYVKARSIVSDIELFDAEFFGFSPKEAELIDPQQRLFLEFAWSAIENAGYNPETYEASIGVYAGVDTNTYLINNICPNFNGIPDLQTFISNATDYLSTRVSYKLNLKGPSVTVQSACSTSLVAVHLACQSLLNGECDMSLAGGVSLSVPEKAGYFYQEGGFASVDGHCRSFDAEASGTVFGEGIGIVVLKRLADAITDGDCIHGIIKGSAINNDGSSKAGYTALSPDGQSAVISEAQTIAGIKPETLTYIEAHGTGTVLGDSIEISALSQVFRQSTDKTEFCAIGAVKTNLGHLSIASGIASLIKTILSLKHQLIPPSLHFEQPNPQIDFATSPFYVNTELSEWKTNGTPRRAGVNSFGIGGTNAHVILEEAPLRDKGLARMSGGQGDRERCQPGKFSISKGISTKGRKYNLLVLSAKTSSALESATSNLINYLQQHPEANLADVAYTLQVGRRVFDHRLIAMVEDVEDAVTALTSPQRVSTKQQEAKDRSVVFMFTGQDSQYVNLTWELYKTEQVFRQECDRCFELLKSNWELDLRSYLYPTAADTEQAAQQLKQTGISQLALFVIEYALAKLWISWGVQPVAMIGHSIGEYVAACLAEVFSLEDALALVTARGKLPILDAFPERVAQVSLKAPQIPYVSHVTGTWITTQEATSPEYWSNHIRNTVRFESGLQELFQKPISVLLEVGSGRTLSKLAQQHYSKQSEQVVLTSLHHLQEQQSDLESLLETVGQLWLAGVKIDWSGVYAQEQRHRIPLPTYPFERQRYWIEPPSESAHNQQVTWKKKSEIADWFYIPSWKQTAPPDFFQLEKLMAQKQSWLVFIDGCGIGWQMVEQLKSAHQDVIVVKVGEQFSQLSEWEYTINPGKRDDYDFLLTALNDSYKIPQRIAHLWSITPNQHISSRFECLEKSQELGFYSLLFLVQAVGEQNITDSLQISVVSNNMQDLLGEEELCPEKATLLGACKVIPHEYSNITCRSIDLTLPQADTRQWQQLTDRLLAEIATETAEQVIAYRGHHRWVQDFEPLLMKDKTSRTIKLRAGGVYVVTGGMGKLGMIVSHYLAKTVPIKLVLIGRLELPPKVEWTQWLSNHDQQNQISTKIEQVQALEELGAEVLVLKADICNLEQMQTMVEEVKDRFGKIDGVFHLAGVTEANFIQQSSPETVSRVLEPKVKGTMVLDYALKDTKLDFLLLFSSITSIMGGLGQAGYCAANTFLDAFAHYNFFRGETITVSVNWDGWQENNLLDDLITLYGADIVAEFKEFQEKYSITSQEGKEALDYVLSCTVPQVIVSTQNLHYRIEQIRARFTRLLQNREQPQSTYQRPDLRTAYEPPGNDVERQISSIYQELLGVELVGINDNFFDLGGNSLIGIQLTSRLKQKLKVEISISHLFQFPSVAELALVVEKIMIEELEKLTEEEVRELVSDIPN